MPTTHSKCSEIGSRVEVLYKGCWYAGTVTARCDVDQEGQAARRGHYLVQCDVDKEGNQTMVPEQECARCLRPLTPLSMPAQTSAPNAASGRHMHRFQWYQADPRSLLFVGPGLDYVTLCGHWPRLEEKWDFTYVRSTPDQYDAYPPGWGPNTRTGKNLATFAEDVVMPVIDQLVKDGRGPAAILCGSRGGQVTCRSLWALGWRGPVLCVNAGCVFDGRAMPAAPIPEAPVRLMLVTGGKDWMPTSQTQFTKRSLRKEDPQQPVLLYHDPEETHMIRSSDVIGPLLEVLVNEEAFQSAAKRPTWLSDPQTGRQRGTFEAL